MRTAGGGGGGEPSRSAQIAAGLRDGFNQQGARRLVNGVIVGGRAPPPLNFGGGGGGGPHRGYPGNPDDGPLPRTAPKPPKTTQYRRRYFQENGEDDGGEFGDPEYDWDGEGEEPPPSEPRGWARGDSSIGVPDGASDLITDASADEAIPPNPEHEHTSRACRVFRNSLLHLPRGIHFPRLAERVVLHPNIRRFRALCFGKSPADTAKFWRKAPRAGPEADLGPAEQDEDLVEEPERPRPRPRDQDELTAVFKQLAETIGKAVGKGKGSGGNPDPRMPQVRRSEG